MWKTVLECRKIVTGTYLTTTNSLEFSWFRGISTYTQDGNFFFSSSSQSGVPGSQPFGNIQGSWKCISSREITGTTLQFNYPTATLPGSISRSNFCATYDPKAETVQATITFRNFLLNANPLNDYAPVAGTFTLIGQRVKPWGRYYN